jgi:hypothetical protein
MKSGGQIYGLAVTSASVTSVPEPGTLSLLNNGVCGSFCFTRSSKSPHGPLSNSSRASSPPTPNGARLNELQHRWMAAQSPIIEFLRTRLV